MDIASEGFQRAMYERNLEEQQTDAYRDWVREQTDIARDRIKEELTAQMYGNGIGDQGGVATSGLSGHTTGGGVNTNRGIYADADGTIKWDEKEPSNPALALVHYLRSLLKNPELSLGFKNLCYAK